MKIIPQKEVLIMQTAQHSAWHMAGPQEKYEGSLTLALI